VYHVQGKNEKALSALEKAILINHSKGYDYLLLKELHQKKWMLQAIKRENIEKRYIMSIIKKSKLDFHWIDAFLFGVPKVVINDCEVHDETWKTIKSKKLFFYLLLHREKKVTQDCLISALWKKASYKSGTDSLRKAIQYIRQILKSGKKKKLDLIISGKGLYQISPEISVRLDIEEFQNLVKQVKNLKHENEKYEDYLKKAISTYREGFAVGWYDPWVEDLRLFYQGLYEDCLVMMADFYFGKNKFKEAIIWCKRLISFDFYNEEYHRKLMRAYSKIGRYKEIIKDFEQLKKILKKDLSSEPQEETVRLYKSLCSKKS
jgi:DNA-binding SARP family transcriptional activator